jgi:uncharacterized protein
MHIEPPVKLMLIYVDESDKHNGIPLYEAIIEFLFHSGVSGATASFSAMGFGANRRIHKKGLFGVTDDRTVTISIIENETVLRAILPRLKEFIPEGLIFLLDGEVLHLGVSEEDNATA